MCMRLDFPAGPEWVEPWVCDLLDGPQRLSQGQRRVQVRPSDFLRKNRTYTLLTGDEHMFTCLCYLTCVWGSGVVSAG